MAMDTTTEMQMNATHKQAAEQSKTQGTQFVVYVFDQGRDVYDSEQARRYAPFLTVEAVYMNGVKVAA